MTKCVFGDDVRANFIDTTNDEQNHLAKYIKQFKSKTRPRHN